MRLINPKSFFEYSWLDFNNVFFFFRGGGGSFFVINDM
jgi:hypothetical protein